MQKQRAVAWNEVREVIRRMLARAVVSAQPKIFLCHVSLEHERKLEQGWVTQFRADLTAFGFFVVSGDDVCSKLSNSEHRPSSDELEASLALVLNNVDAVLFIGTPVFKAKIEGDYESNCLKLELKCAMALAEAGKAQIFPILRAGDAATSLPESLRRFFVRDFREDEQYARLMIGLLNPLGLIPAITRVHQVSPDYRAAVEHYVTRALAKHVRERNTQFVGCSQPIQELAALLQHGPVAIVQETSVPVLGGVGKSELAAEFAWRSFRKPYVLIRWVNASNADLEIQGTL